MMSVTNDSMLTIYSDSTIYSLGIQSVFQSIYMLDGFWTKIFRKTVSHQHIPCFRRTFGISICWQCYYLAVRRMMMLQCRFYIHHIIGRSEGKIFHLVDQGKFFSLQLRTLEHSRIFKDT